MDKSNHKLFGWSPQVAVNQTIVRIRVTINSLAGPLRLLLTSNKSNLGQVAVNQTIVWIRVTINSLAGQVAVNQQ